MIISEKLIIQACKDLQARIDNHGGWPEKKIPDSLVEIRKLLNLPSYNYSWVLTVESAIKRRAVEFVAKNN